MTRDVRVTKEGLSRLEASLREERRRLEDATAILRELSGSSDDYEDSGLEDARQEKARLEVRVDELEDQLQRAVVIEPHDRTAVDLGAVVTLESDGEALQVQLVSPVEAEIVNEAIPHISDASPLGKALLGRRVGETFEVATGRRTAAYTVVSIR